MLLLLLILAAAIAAYIAASQSGKKQLKEEAEKESQYTVTDFDAESVREISYTNESGSYTFQKSEEAGGVSSKEKKVAWYSEEEPAADIRESTVMSVIEYAADITSLYKIEEAEDLAAYGLENPARTVIVTLENKTVRLYFGDYNEMTGCYYLRLNDEKTVYSVAEDVFNAFGKTMEDFKEIEKTKDNK